MQATGIKQEEDEVSNMMDIDSIYDDVEQDGGVETGNRYVEDTKADIGVHIPSENGHTREDDADADSDDSFVCELLPNPDVEINPSNSDLLSRDGSVTGSAHANGSQDPESLSVQGPFNKSATFNQSWSDEEQRLLDILLQEFPDGTRNRQVVLLCKIVRVY